MQSFYHQKNKKISGKIFILCNNKSYSFNDIVKIISKVLNVNIKLNRISYPKDINPIEKDLLLVVID